MWCVPPAVVVLYWKSGLNSGDLVSLHSTFILLHVRHISGIVFHQRQTMTACFPCAASDYDKHSAILRISYCPAGIIEFIFLTLTDMSSVEGSCHPGLLVVTRTTTITALSTCVVLTFATELLQTNGRKSNVPQNSQVFLNKLIGVHWGN